MRPGWLMGGALSIAVAEALARTCRLALDGGMMSSDVEALLRGTADRMERRRQVNAMIGAGRPAVPPPVDKTATTVVLGKPKEYP